MPPPIRTRPYRELLTPTLHRRFTQAAGVCLLLCYIEAVVIAWNWKSSLLWSWFPLGWAGLRTLILYICPLLVFILRVAQLHCGTRSTASPYLTLRHYLWSWDVLETSIAYVSSALLFSEVYIWSVSSDAELNWVVQGRSWERAQLNEKPIYLRSLYIGLALLQTALHLYFDYDKVEESVHGAVSDPLTQTNSDVIMGPRKKLISKMPDLLRELAIISAGLSVIGPILYSLTFRGIAWRSSLVCARFFRWDIPHTQELSYVPPYHWALILRSFFSGLLLLLIWHVSNIAFSVYVAQEPLKQGQPLTQDSKDPNGSLINGLKAKKSVVKAFAYWELAMICQRFSDRRVIIFRDIDRQGGSAWTQVSSECLRMLEGVTTRISAYGQPSTRQQALIKPEDLQSLPRLGMPLKQEPIFLNTPQPSTRREKMETRVGSFAKSVGDYPVTNYGSPLGPKGQQYLEAARNGILSPENQQALTPAGLRSQFNLCLTRFLHSQFGQPFRQTFARRIRSIAFGHPFSELIPTIDAVQSITSMVTASLKEDAYGKVAKDIPLVIRTFIMTYQTLECFANTLSPHWTDIEFSDSQRQTEDVLALKSALRQGLEGMVKTFGGFSADLGIPVQDIRIAKTIAGIT
ncbi:MAG: hypothetical protein Q9218_004597 [Villophora microphyllina]